MIHQLGFIALIILFYFFIGWLISYKISKYAWIDFFWSSSFMIILFFLWPIQWNTPYGLAACLMISWSIRLSLLLIKRIWREGEDPRYEKLKHHWGPKSPLYFLFLYIFEGLLALILCLPAYIQLYDDGKTFNFWHLIGSVLFIISLMGETLSDYQLTQFKNANKGLKKVCDIGLWNYSRHPNYFFEIMIWFSLGIYGVGSSQPILGFVPFLLMLTFITKFTGVPYAEQQALQSRGDLYRDYQKRTNKLIPWFPKENIK